MKLLNANLSINNFINIVGMRTYLLIASFFISAISFAQPQWINAVGGGGMSHDYAKASCMDAQGNIYIAGGFNCCSATFDTATLTGAGDYDIFILKYNHSGYLIWARGVGGDGDEMANGISVDTNGNVFVAGYYTSDSLTFGTNTIFNHDSSASIYGGDIFVAKYDNSGNAIWAKGIGSVWTDRAFGLTTDNSGNVLFTGYFDSDSLLFDTITVKNLGYSACFFTKYDPNGNVIWAKQECSGNTTGNAIITDAYNNVYITGSFDGHSLIVSSTVWVYSNCMGSGCSDYFVAKYDSAGHIIWAQGRTGTHGNTFGNALCIDGGNNLLVAGDFYGYQLAFDSLPLVNQHSTGYHGEVFVVKYDQNGNGLWVSKVGAIYDDWARSITTDASGNVYVSGLSSNIYAICNSDSIIGDFTDGYVVKFSANGNTLWALPLRGEGHGLSIDSNQKLFVSGWYGDPTAAFGPTTLINTGSNSTDIFLAVLDTSSFSVSADQIIFANANHMSISPNPFNNQTEIALSNSLQDGSMKIYDSFGKCISSFKNISGNRFTIDRSNMQAGIYVIEFTDKSAKRTIGKIVVVD